MSKNKVDSIEDAIKDLRELINEHWCDEFVYGESCKHCVVELFCERLAETMYPGIFTTTGKIALVTKRRENENI